MLIRCYMVSCLSKVEKGFTLGDFRSLTLLHLWTKITKNFCFLLYSLTTQIACRNLQLHKTSSCHDTAYISRVSTISHTSFIQLSTFLQGVRVFYHCDVKCLPQTSCSHQETTYPASSQLSNASSLQIPLGIDKILLQSLSGTSVYSQQQRNSPALHSTQYRVLGNFHDLLAKLNFRIFIFANGELTIYIVYIANDLY